MNRTIIRNTLIFIIITMLIVSSFLVYKDYATKQVNYYQSKIVFYQEIMNTEQEWIINSQLDNGAFPFRPLSNNKADVIPYFSTITAMSLLQGNSNDYTNQVIKYVEWMLSRLNTKDEDYFNIDGTMSNFQIERINNKLVETTYKYDSVDSYNALFLALVDKVYSKTNDNEFLLRNESNIVRVINALLSTRNANGLSLVSVGNRTQYTMDNVEVNYGLKSSANLINKLIKISSNTDKLTIIQNQIDTWLKENTQAIQTYLWSSETSKFHVAINTTDQVVEFKGWDVFYPDAVAQLYPIVFDYIEPSSAQASELYQLFNDEYDWEQFNYRDSGDFHWTVIVYIASLMQDIERVEEYLKFYSKNVIPTHPYPIYNAEVAWVINASQTMIEYYENKLNKIDPFKIFH